MVRNGLSETEEALVIKLEKLSLVLQGADSLVLLPYRIASWPVPYHLV